MTPESAVTTGEAVAAAEPRRATETNLLLVQQ